MKVIKLYGKMSFSLHPVYLISLEKGMLKHRYNSIFNVQRHFPCYRLLAMME